ncbi:MULTISPECIES: LysR family transcriptional regulator [unclassified Paraburkholderia]|uniref:LysR family transcriptional regulator n=1 Tax=unclassified Paraburkholderia TaxID=2615204 RepID=UPI0020B76F35|nr:MULTISPECIES: LysR family transcriptional regulator [unclassified Paraburkholderia]MCP3716344.1 LysR substrate-binding domain-containing protein [Paraburkholderia sp. CNPSo 3281]MCX5541012.1 LysR substrate-binding domain-containing protein [Paraburkholderia sp. CNPSo 3076]
MEMNDLAAFVSVARAGGFRDAARVGGVSASSLSAAVRRLEAKLGLRLLNRTTRSVAPTEAGQRLLESITPLFSEMEAALDVLNGYREKPAGTLKLNVPASAARTILPRVLAPFHRAYPEIRVEVVVEDGFVDVLQIGCDAGIRYDERLEQDMIAIPIGARVERFATVASPAYLAARGRPDHPRELLDHACLRVQFAGGAMPLWHFERDGEVLRLDPPTPLVVRPGAALDLLINMALDGVGIVYLFEEMLLPHIRSGALVRLLDDWDVSFPGPFLYYPGRRHLPAPLRAFVDFVKANASDDSAS